MPAAATEEGANPSPGSAGRRPTSGSSSTVRAGRESRSRCSSSFCRSVLRPLVAVEGKNDVAHEAVADDVLVGEVDESHACHTLKNPLDLMSPEAFGSGRSICVISR